MKKVFAVLGPLALLMTGCGEPKCGDERAPATRCAAPPEPTACEDLGDAYARVDETARPCVSEGEESPRRFELARCESNIHRCTEPEVRALAELSDCFRATPVCTPATEDQYNGSLFVCAVTAASRLSAECLEILPDVNEAGGPPGSLPAPLRLLRARAALHLVPGRD